MEKLQISIIITILDFERIEEYVYWFYTDVFIYYYFFFGGVGDIEGVHQAF